MTGSALGGGEPRIWPPPATAAAEQEGGGRRRGKEEGRNARSLAVNEGGAIKSRACVPAWCVHCALCKGRKALLAPRCCCCCCCDCLRKGEERRGERERRKGRKLICSAAPWRTDGRDGPLHWRAGPTTSATTELVSGEGGLSPLTVRVTHSWEREGGREGGRAVL